MQGTVKSTSPLPGSRNTGKLKICLLGYRSNPYSGGQGIYISYLSKALVDAGHEVDVISGQPYPNVDPGVRLIKLPGLNLFESENHVTALRLKHLRSWTDFFEWFSMLTGGFPEPYTFGRRLVKYFEDNSHVYDIVHDNQSLCYGLCALQRKGVPLVTTIHHPITSDLEIALASANSLRAKLLIRRWHSFIHMQKKVVRQLKHIVTVSRRSRQDIASAFDIDPKKIDVVHNGIDTGTFRPIPAVERIPFRIMATASADTPLKGLHYLLRALAMLTPEYPRLELVVLGKIKECGHIQRLIDKLGIGQHIRFVSGLQTEEIVHLYAEAGMAVVPSIYEGFGLPAGEAMACGTPVISTTGGALPEVVGNAGILIPVKDPDAIAHAIKYLLENPKKRDELSRKGRERIVDSFSWEVAAAKMVDFYTQILNEQPDNYIQQPVSPVAQET